MGTLVVGKWLYIQQNHLVNTKDMPTKQETYEGKLKTIKEWYRTGNLTMGGYFKLKVKLQNKYLGVSIEEVKEVFEIIEDRGGQVGPEEIGGEPALF